MQGIPGTGFNRVFGGKPVDAPRLVIRPQRVHNDYFVIIFNETQKVEAGCAPVQELDAVRKDCAGLCPTCGKNLNEGKCRCPKNKIDPRWSKLAELK